MGLAVPDISTSFERFCSAWLSAWGSACHAGRKERWCVVHSDVIMRDRRVLRSRLASECQSGGIQSLNLLLGIVQWRGDGNSGEENGLQHGVLLSRRGCWPSVFEARS